MNQASRPAHTDTNKHANNQSIKNIFKRMTSVKKQLSLFAVLSFMVFRPTSAQLNCIQEKTYFGINLANTLVVCAASKIMNPNVTY